MNLEQNENYRCPNTTLQNIQDREGRKWRVSKACIKVQHGRIAQICNCCRLHISTPLITGRSCVCLTASTAELRKQAGSSEDIEVKSFTGSHTVFFRQNRVSWLPTSGNSPTVSNVSSTCQFLETQSNVSPISRLWHSAPNWKQSW